MAFRVCLSALALCASASVGAAAAEQPSPAAEIEAYLAPFVERGDLSGNLLVARGDTVVFERSYGMANYELGVPITADTRFNIASVTKPMTVIALIHLAADGKLSLDDPLSKWIPDFPRGGEITIGHLARHRAGIPHRVTEDGDEATPHTAADMVEFAKARSLTAEPGETYNYSSAGFSVLARVLELASRLSYGQLLREAVFDPVGMPHSSHADSRTVLEGRAASYLPSADGGIINAPLKDLSYLVGAGSVFSTARDLYALVIAVRKGALGPGAQQSFVDDDGLDWNGVAPGFRAFADWHKDTDVTVIFLSNLQTGAANLIRSDIARIAAGDEVAPAKLPEIEPVAVAESTLARWQGVYELRPGSPLRVYLDAGVLRVNDWVLVPVGERRFFSPQDYGFVEVVLDEAGKPTRLDWKIGDTPYPCPRIGDL